MTQAIFWQPDALHDAAAKLPEWRLFHRRCGDHGVSFVIVHPPKRAVALYGCVANRYERTPKGYYREIEIARGEGATPIDALLAAFAGVPELDPSLGDELRALLAPVDPVLELIG